MSADQRKIAIICMTVIASLIIIAVLIPIASAEESADAPDKKITVKQDGFNAELSIEYNLGETVIWDLGDGRILSEPYIDATWKSGLYLIKVAVITSEGIEDAERWIGFYDTTPPTTVAKNEEYRYGVYAGQSAPSIIIKDFEGNVLQTWLKYDHDKRVISGYPKETGIYNVWFGEKHWKINVIETGIDRPTVWLKINADITDDTINASPEGPVQPDSARYSWSLRDIDGTLVSAFEGKNMQITADPGLYILKLQQMGPEGYAEYSTMVHLTGPQVIEEDEDEEKTEIPSYVRYGVAILAIIALLVVVRFL